MGNVVQLNERQRARRVVASTQGKGATIHLFLGVRYERHAEQVQPAAPEQTGGGSRRPRKRA